MKMCNDKAMINAQKRKGFITDKAWHDFGPTGKIRHYAIGLGIWNSSIVCLKAKTVKGMITETQKLAIARNWDKFTIERNNESTASKPFNRKALFCVLLPKHKINNWQ
jgi:hypothetical protein